MKMKNIDRIRKMSAEELYEWKTTSSCGHCENNKSDGCNLPFDACKEAQVKWLEAEAEMTADEMFKELGYETKGQELYTILYVKNTEESKEEIRLHKSVHEEWEYEKYCNTNIYACPYTPLLITKAEHEAICKKLEELKGKK